MDTHEIIGIIWKVVFLLEFFLLSINLGVFIYDRNWHMKFYYWLLFDFWGFWVKPKYKLWDLVTRIGYNCKLEIIQIDRRGTKINYIIKIIPNKEWNNIDRTLFTEKEFLTLFVPYVRPIRLIKESGLSKWCKEYYHV